MKSLTNLLHKTPWWALVFGALAVFAALAVFVTPYHIIQYREDGATPEQTRAIKREIDNTFAENAINVGRSVIRGMLARATDPETRQELEQALEGLEEARTELREAGADVLRAKREVLDSARQAARTARDALKNVRRETERALKQLGPEDHALRQQLQDTLREAEAAEREATRAVQEGRGARIVIGGSKSGGEPLVDIEIPPPAKPAPPKAPATPPVPGAKGVPQPPAPPQPGVDVPAVQPPSLVLPPEVRTKIRRDVTGDMYRIGIGIALIVILVPLFILAIVTKFFADRSRAATRMADLKRKEAEYHRMGQQVTEAKLAALQAQVEPHFLYNTLASVQALTEVDPAKANAMTGHLIQYLRNALPKMRESVSTVGQELELVRAYLSILQMRMGTRLAFDIDVSPDLAALPFPPLMLPSLVENAIKHGLEPQREGGRVDIRAELEDGKLRLVVADTGRGFAETVGAGVGLANIRERLAALYGGAAKLTLVANEPRGVVATIEVPAAGTGSAFTAGPTDSQQAAGAAAAGAPQAAFAAAPAFGESSPEPAKPAGTGFWAGAWNAGKIMERIWRKALWYLFLGLVALGAIAAVAGLVAVATGLAPIQLDDTIIGGPGGALVGVAAILIAFVAIVVGAAAMTTVFYALGFLLAGVAVFAVLAILVGLSPVIAPFVLLVLFIWWMANKRGKGEKPAPILPGPPPIPPAEPGR